MKVFIEGYGFEYNKMFEEFNWEVTRSFSKADLIQFTGGADVSPSLYGEFHHYTTHSTPARDDREVKIFNVAKAKGIPIAGICRGGQFVNVMCGGKLWQDVDNHGLTGTHEATDLFTKETFRVTSTHHQMMRPSIHGVTVLVAHESTYRVSCAKENNFRKVLTNNDYDIEAVFYPEQRSFCFQPHPEFSNAGDLRKRYMKYLEMYLYQGGH